MSESGRCLTTSNGYFPSILYHIDVSRTGQKATLMADEPHIPTVYDSHFSNFIDEISCHLHIQRPSFVVNFIG